MPKDWKSRISPRWFRVLMNCWPPFMGAGIVVQSIATDFSAVTVCLKSRRLCQNYVGTQFGGSMFVMTDPFYMLILLKNLGRDYIVWDKASRIDYLIPGRGPLTAHFIIPPEEMADIRRKVDEQGKIVFDKTVVIKNAAGENVASVVKTLYVKRKQPTERK